MLSVMAPCKHLSIAEQKLPQNSVETLESSKPNNPQYFTKCLEYLVHVKSGQSLSLRSSTFAALSVSLYRFEKAYALHRVTKLADFLPIRLLLKAHYDFLKG
jgi:hypothetical protein